MPLDVRIFAAMPPECPEPTIRTSYVFTGIYLSLADWIDWKPIIAAAAESAGEAAPRLLRSGSPLARIHSSGPKIFVYLCDELLQRVTRKIFGPGPYDEQRAQNSVGLL